MGFGIWAPQLDEVPFVDLWALPGWTGDETDAALAQDWYLSGLSAPEPVDIPYAWLAGPFRSRQDKAVTYAAVTKSNAGTAIAAVPTDRQVKFEAEIASLNDTDAPNLAHFMTVYYDQPRTRLAQVRLHLNERDDTDIWTILGVGIGDRIRITDPPATWPADAAHQIVEGIGHESGGDRRVVVWSTSPVIGEDLGEVGPFFRIGASTLDGPDKLPW